MDCRCDTVTELYGDEAEGYLAEHLRQSPGDTYSRRTDDRGSDAITADEPVAAQHDLVRRENAKGRSRGPS